VAAIHPITALQSAWLLWTRDPWEKVLPAARRSEIGMMPSHAGFSPGRFPACRLSPRTIFAAPPRFQADNLQRDLQMVTEVAPGIHTSAR